MLNQDQINYRTSVANLLVIVRTYRNLTLNELRNLAKLPDNTKDFSFKGNGNKAMRKAGFIPVPFSCYCAHSPCQHEFRYENDRYDWVHKSELSND
jgi:hypothetical protein